MVAVEYRGRKTVGIAEGSTAALSEIGVKSKKRQGPSGKSRKKSRGGPGPGEN